MGIRACILEGLNLNLCITMQIKTQNIQHTNTGIFSHRGERDQILLESTAPTPSRGRNGSTSIGSKGTAGVGEVSQ